MRTPAGFFFPGCGMKFAKPPLSIEDQVALLKRRGMIIDDEARARHALAHINYYRLRAYWLPFEQPADAEAEHVFRPGTRFATVLEYYAFDQRLKLLLLDAIERVEISLRTRWAHELAMRHGSHAYLVRRLFADRQRYGKCLEQLKEEVARSHETFIRHYRETYSNPTLPPIWAACEVLTLGQLSQWFDNLKHRIDRQAIAQAFGIDEIVLRAFAHHLAAVRNLCAHHSRVWNRKFTIRMKLPRHPADIAPWFNPAEDHKLYNTLLMLALLLNRVTPDSTWKKRLLELLATMPEGTTEVMGFPNGWREFEVWAR